ncbi:MAG: branched-chain amino acid ABC transporter permease [Burkholderiales bacterium]|nr:branched-chain amino acid ABC transporter permease [Burkholderiales bacterium]MDG1225186.1 branched-chain amino acid ABC transporter permease [Burkholderiales bacterium]MDG2202305.1 branched-chain amino acid ABC transporter permease [Burkholderiales bacterium]|tara:strand:+ start:2653 stop:3564 length:912 start_codon:yes stop_codon:yes gene_type:complete
MGFFVEVLISGLMAGVLYSLVALGFVLIFKASGVFNFAQGAMVLFAALTFVRLLDILKDTFAPITIALIITIAMMVILAMAVERLVLRPLVNQPGISLFMATLGIAYFLDGFGQTLWGSDIYTLDVGIPKGSIFILESIFEGGVLVAKEDLVATVIAGLLVIVLAIFFQRTRIGRALRAVADDHQAAQSIGIPLNYIWVIVWTVAGLVALVAGVIWGSKLGVQFSLSLIALKALPVLILGGFESVLGAVIGGLIIGAGEKLSEIYLGPYVGGGIEYWFAYMLALGFLMFRPQGLFGEVHIDRV